MRSGRRVINDGDHQCRLIWYAQDDSLRSAARYFEIIDWCRQQWGDPSEESWSWDNAQIGDAFLFDDESKLLMFKLRFA
jgi:hypothetical protein